MENFIIDPKHPGSYYVLFNVLTYTVGLILLIVYGRKIKLPTLPWLLTITSAFIFFIAGCKLIAMHSSDWQFLWLHHYLPRDPGRSLLGGLGLGLMGILIGRWYFNLPWKSIDAFAWALPIGIAIHRLGCFAAGCCFGTSSEVPWAVLYGTQTTTTFQHSIQSLGNEGLKHTHTLHPVQLYELLLCLVIVVALFPLSKKMKNAGSLLGSSVALYCIVRSITEFFRFQPIDNGTVGWLNSTQLILIVAFFTILLIVCLIEKAKASTKVYIQIDTLSKSGYFFLWCSLLCLLTSFVLLPFEIITIQLAMIPCLILIIYKAYQLYTAPNFRLAGMFFVAFSFLIMGQTVPEKTPDTEEEDKLSTVKRYHSIYTGILSGNSEIIDQSTNCEGDPIAGTRTDYKNQYYNYAAGYTHSVEYNDPEDVLQSISFGMQGFWGRQLDRATGLYSMERILTVYGVSPHIRLETKKIGLAFGGTIGNFAKIDAITDERSTTLTRYWLYPMASIRYGRVDKFYVETRIGDFFPSAFPGFTTQVAVGFMDKNKRNGLRIGTASNAALFINPTVAIGENWSIAPMLGFGGAIIHNFYEQNNFQASFKLQYKFEAKSNE